MSEEKEFEILNFINSPSDVKALDEKDLPKLCGEIRDFLVDKVSENGGHLASNLGVVELSVALHRVFETPKDHIVWDVGHQSYVHKMLTGRKGSFDTLRKNGGLSGFTKRSESCHDAFGAGHSSTSISAALGLAEADRLSGIDAYTVAVLGDGAFTGGMVHEALNNCDSNLKLIIVINENEMSISKNIGRFADSLSKIRLSEGYFNTKMATAKFLNAIPILGKGTLKLLKNVKRTLKNALYGSNYFEKMGLYYLGPADGNDVEAVEDVLRLAKRQQDSVIVHLKTKKGKGYAPAEENPDKYHSLSPRGASCDTNFSKEFGKIMTELGEKDESIVAITAAMCDGTGLGGFREKFPERFFDVGIAEPHAVTFAAGLAAGGKKPCVAIYSTFLQRAYDNIIHDVALQELPVCFCIDRAGLNPSDGPTHHGIFDVAFLSQIPGIKIYTPATYGALKIAVKEAFDSSIPCAVRYPRGAESEAVREHFYKTEPKDAGIRADFEQGDRLDAVIVTYGRIAAEAIKAKKSLASNGINVGIILLEFLKPYRDIAKLVTKAMGDRILPMVTLEEEIKNGGAGMLLSEELVKNHGFARHLISIMAIDDNFGFSAENENIYKTLGISAEDVEREITKLI